MTYQAGNFSAETVERRAWGDEGKSWGAKNEQEEIEGAENAKNFANDRTGYEMCFFVWHK